LYEKCEQRLQISRTPTGFVGIGISERSYFVSRQASLRKIYRQSVQVRFAVTARVLPPKRGEGKEFSAESRLVTRERRGATRRETTNASLDEDDRASTSGAKRGSRRCHINLAFCAPISPRSASGEPWDRGVLYGARERGNAVSVPLAADVERSRELVSQMKSRTRFPVNAETSQRAKGSSRSMIWTSPIPCSDASTEAFSSNRLRHLARARRGVR